MISLIAAELVPMGILKDLLAVKNLDVVVANYVCLQAPLEQSHRTLPPPTILEKPFPCRIFKVKS